MFVEFRIQHKKTFNFEKKIGNVTKTAMTAM